MGRRNPCLACGVCCTMFRVSFYWAEAGDVMPGGVPVELTEKFGPHRLVMRGTNDSSPRCVALEGEVCESVRCAIHANRSSVCRAFEASYECGRPNPRCDEARAKRGMPALAPEDWESPCEDDGWEPPLSPAA